MITKEVIEDVKAEIQKELDYLTMKSRKEKLKADEKRKIISFARFVEYYEMKPESMIKAAIDLAVDERLNHDKH